MTPVARSAEPLDPAWRRPRPSTRGYRRDSVLALAMLGGTALSVTLTRAAGVMSESPWWQVAIWVVLMAGPLALRRRLPELVALVIALVFGVGAMFGVGDGFFASICLYLAIYAVGAWSHNQVLSRWVRLCIIAGMFIWLFWQLIVQANQATAMPDLSRDGFFSPYAAFGMLQVLINLLYFWAAYYFGDTAWQSAQRSAALAERTRELAAERERTAAQAVTLERVRIARELHDVVAHHVSVMGVQAGAARRILDRDPIAAAAALGVIEHSARSAIDELQTMLGTLRADDDQAGASQSPSTHTVDHLSDLADESRAGGVPTALSIIGDPRPVPGTIGQSIYRVVQESLTNTRKHAGRGASAEVRLRYETDAVEVEITDTGSGPRVTASSALPTPAASGCGLGQRGMRERVLAVNGQLHLGARPRGGYIVRARFPLLSTQPIPQPLGATAPEPEPAA
ncbi:sensor histidine kinase [Cryobacterium melibiosiphilum]|uniref:histidine kinase n=1 Tax=Cryobacterium melibiosiphilum TaxID=995039 RepID=A0A3A5MWR8_9MICO|nr:sensor histidine kinase [Cryobacterium melibiosiphilum]RJT89644.1 sensor histidine kinase [Cryobacterium melibiosiphilum]